jgi:PAS domain S-box-containing protein
MKLTNPITNILNTVREQAEAIISSKGNVELKKDESVDLPSMIYELEVHQVELELQNEELRQSQLSLANEHDRYLELYEHAPITYLALDKTGRIQGANSKSEELFSLLRSQIIGQKLSKFVSKASQDDLYLHQQSVFSDFTKQSTELTLKGKSSVKVVRIESIAVISHNEKRTHSHTVLIDITAEYKADQALKKLNADLENKVAERTHELTKQNDLLSTILNTATDAIITISKIGLIEAINPITESMFGYTEQELLGKKISILMPDPHKSQHNDYLARYWQTGETHIIGSPRELLAMRKDGSLFPISLNVNKMEKIPSFTGIIRDVSERIELEKEVLACIEGERNRISRDLHDSIGQNLVGIAMQARGMSKHLEDKQFKEWEEIKNFGEDLEKVGHSLRSIVSNLALFDLDELNQITDVIMMMVRNYTHYSDANIKTELSEGLYIERPMVATQLLRIMQEGLNNAVKHSKAKNITIKIIQDATYIKLTIIDDGIGFDKKDSGHDKSEGGYGFGNMRYRAHIIGANLEIISTKKSGTRIVCTIIN